MKISSRKKQDLKIPGRTTENVAYHAARLLIVISYCGKPRGPRATTTPAIAGRTLLAKLDFFLRYPSYLKRASRILRRNLTDDDVGLEEGSAGASVESRMVRYLYGPWDHIYYPALAYLIGKELITVENLRGNDIFRITTKGQELAGMLARDPVYADLVRRADAAYRLFNQFNGNRLKDFIYQHFPEVVGRKIGEII